MSRFQDLNARLEELKDRGLYRVRRELDGPQGTTVWIRGRSFLNFCSNDYLGLANDRRMIAALQRGAVEYGVGSGASQLVCGRSSAHALLEQELAVFTGRERALVFGSGYLANLSLATAFCPGRDDLIVQDRLCHASLIDGALLSRARFKRYPHKDVRSLDTILQRAHTGEKLVLTDGVFSMDGDIAPLDDLSRVCQSRGAFLAVDDAHGFGVSGNTGRGTLEQLGLGQAEVPVLMGTFGKALGAYGAFIAGAAEFIELLIQRARPYIYTTALPPALAVAVAEGLRIVGEESWRRESLQQLIKKFRRGALQSGLPLLPSDTPIQPLIIGDAARSVEISEKLFKEGILVTAIRPPTVPENTSRLRVTLSAVHKEEQVDALLEALSAAIVPSLRDRR